jgi:spore germination cell wall hydrolase CwlJ-like protein
MIISTAALCLALNVYMEARGETIPGQYAVALVTLNRAKSNKEVCREVFKPKQFSWANKGVKRTAKGWVISKALQPRDAEAWQKAQIIANVVLKGRFYDITYGATHYHAHWVSPIWRHSLQPTKRIGAHHFYRLPVSQG